MATKTQSYIIEFIKRFQSLVFYNELAQTSYSDIFYILKLNISQRTFRQGVKIKVINDLELNMLLWACKKKNECSIIQCS